MRMLATLSLLVLLTGCGDGSPSEGDIAHLLQERANEEIDKVAPLLRAQGRDVDSLKVKITDLKKGECKVSTAVPGFLCSIAFTATSGAGTKSTTVTLRFLKVDGNWSVSEP